MLLRDPVYAHAVGCRDAKDVECGVQAGECRPLSEGVFFARTHLFLVSWLVLVCESTFCPRKLEKIEIEARSRGRNLTGRRQRLIQFLVSLSRKTSKGL